MTSENSDIRARKISGRKKFILWFLLPYILYLFIHRFVLAKSVCATFAGFDGSQISAVVAFFWPAMMLFLVLFVMRGKDLFSTGKKVLLRQQPFNGYAVGCLIFLLAFALLVAYSFYRANLQHDRVQQLMNSAEWPAFVSNHCS